MVMYYRCLKRHMPRNVHMCRTMTAHMLAHKLYACVNLLTHPNAHLQKHGRTCLHTCMHTDTRMLACTHARMHSCTKRILSLPFCLSMYSPSSLFITCLDTTFFVKQLCSWKENEKTVCVMKCKC